MPPCIAILDDDPCRIESMRDQLSELLPQYPVVTFDHAGPMIAWLSDHLPEVVLISLDHDLSLEQYADHDPGTGRDVADYLAGLEPVCPVIVHSSNMLPAAGMVHALQRANWPVWQVHPFGDLDWISEAWRPQVAELVERGWVFVKPP